MQGEGNSKFAEYQQRSKAFTCQSSDSLQLVFLILPSTMVFNSKPIDLIAYLYDGCVRFAVIGLTLLSLKGHTALALLATDDPSIS